MKEIKVVIKLTVYSNDRDKELMDEAIYSQLQDLMEVGDLNYSYKVIEADDEDEEENEMQEFDL